MDIGNQVNSSFVLIHADWTRSRALEILSALRPENIIVYRQDDENAPEYFYLLDLEETLGQLERRQAAQDVREALDLHEFQSTATIEATTEAASAPVPAIVIDRGRLLGFVDTQRGRTRGAPVERDVVVREEPTEISGGPSEAEEVNRTILARFPVQIAQGETGSLRVLLTAIPRPGEGVPVSAKLGEQIDILVEARRGFTVEESEAGTLTVTEDEEGLPLLFKIRATDVGPGLIVVFAFHQGQPLGRISLSPTVTEPTTLVAEQQITRTAEAPLAPLAVHVPDLDLLIQEWPVGTEHQYSIILTAKDSALGLHLSKFGPLRLRMDPVKYFGDFFTEIEQLPLNSASDKQVAAKKLETRGTSLFNTLFPADLRSLLWSLKDRIQSIWIQSEEPWIPWELCKLESEAHDPGPFLCEAYSVTRWVPGRGISPSLSLKNLGVVVPSDTGLPLAQTEKEFLVSLAGNGRQVTPIAATWADVYAALQSGLYDGLHFTGHGAARDENPDRSRMILEQGNEFLPQDVSGEAARLGRTHPVVFLNACQIGRGGMSLTGIGGWATRFLDAGAGAFIGAYWSVFDEAAEKFTESVYPLLMGGTPIGEAVKTARAAIKPLGNPTWLAYTVFADPLATVGSS